MNDYLSTDIKRLTILHLKKMKREGEKIAMLTAYDYTMASILDASGIDVILVGDSAANVMAGYGDTIPISLDEIIFYARSVVRAVKHALVVVDMPFGSYQVSKEEALRNAIRIMKETGCTAVKIEGGEEYASTIKAIISAGIPVMGHLGLTPQSVNIFGGYGLRANNNDEELRLYRDAELLKEIGCFSIVLEKIPADVAKNVTKRVGDCPTIGIGAGPYTDGQVLVLQDMLGANAGFEPKFLRKYANLSEVISTAVKGYISDVKTLVYPSESESY